LRENAGEDARMGGGEESASRVRGGRTAAINHLARTVHRPGAGVAGRTYQHPISNLRTYGSETIGGVSYKLEIRGNTVVSIDPRGHNGPLYERAYFRGPVQWREVDRFVPQHTIAW
jgi:hypothetical protein